MVLSLYSGTLLCRVKEHKQTGLDFSYGFAHYNMFSAYDFEKLIKICYVFFITKS